MNQSMRVLWEDNWCLVAWKPPGVLIQGPPGIESFESRLRQFLQERDAHAGQLYLALPHRLDRPVSGAVLVAKNARAAKRFGEQFATRKIDKRYLAIWHGVPQERSGRWEDTMRKIPDRPVAELVPPEHPEAKSAALEFQVLGEADGVALAEIRLETGRMHQIRLQASSRGHPIVGDRLYGSPGLFGPPVKDERECAIALHARRITFRHPQTAVPIEVFAPVPETWLDWEVVKKVVPSVLS